MTKRGWARRKRTKSEKQQWQYPWQDPDRSLSLTDVAEWFSLDPIACARDPRGQEEIRRHDEGARPWYTEERWQEAVERQNISWWNDLREEVRRKVGDDLAAQFADYLAGYALAREFDQLKADPEQPGLVTDGWRRTKRFLQRNGWTVPQLHYPGREHLRTALITQMQQELATSASPWKREFCGRAIADVWLLVSEELSVKPTPDVDATVARISRRSRQRNNRKPKN